MLTKHDFDELILNITNDSPKKKFKKELYNTKDRHQKKVDKYAEKSSKASQEDNHLSIGNKKAKPTN